MNLSRRSVSTLLPLAFAGAAVAAPMTLGSAAASASPLATAYGPSGCTVKVNINPTTLEAGGTITIALSGTCGDRTFTVQIHSTPEVLGTLTTGANGSAAGSFGIPANLPAGVHTVTVADSTGDAAAVTVNLAGAAPANPSSAGQPGSLPHTGTDASRLAEVGAAAVAAGGLLVLTTRRRRVRSFS